MNNFFKNPVVHGVISGLVLAIPLFVLHFSGVADMTVGGILTGLASWLSKEIA